MVAINFYIPCQLLDVYPMSRGPTVLTSAENAVDLFKNIGAELETHYLYKLLKINSPKKLTIVHF